MNQKKKSIIIILILIILKIIIIIIIIIPMVNKNLNEKNFKNKLLDFKIKIIQNTINSSIMKKMIFRI